MQQKLSALFVVFATCAWVLLGLVGMIPAGFSVMMFDAPGSEKNIATNVLVYSLLTFPIICGGAVIASWVTLLSKKYGTACLCACLPLVNCASAASALTWIMLVQGGSFRG
ncbi:MAG TPA: hypothetical protein VGN12_30730 [Pirellulales bacterium]|jgi:hypothetical protein